MAQDNTSEVKLSFMKTNDSIKSTELYFNILKLTNTSTKPVKGILAFNAPEDWKIISFNQEQILINPGDSVSIPVRISPSANAIGGISYILDASFRTSTRLTSINTYLTIPSKPKWEFSTNSNNLYFTEYSPNTVFKIKLSNKGNTNELIKLHLKIGKLLVFQNNASDDYIEFVNLSAFKDTIVSYSVSYQKTLSFTDKLRYENNWKETAILATASTEKTEKSAAIMIHKLNSTFVNQRLQNSSPLNIDYETYNLMSNQPVRSNVKVYGTLLFPKSREIQYIAGVQNIYYGNSPEKFNIDQQLLYSLRYFNKKNDVELGYNINGGNLHAINGRGISGLYKLNSQDVISYAFTQNPFSQTLGAFLGYDFVVKNVSFSTDVTHENSISHDYNANSVMLGTGFTLFKHHSFSVQVLGSSATYKQALRNDTSLMGYSYKIDYGINYKKFDLRLSALNSMRNYIRNSGLEQFYLDSKYTLTSKVAFSLYGNRQYYSATRFPFNFYNPTSFNSTDYLKLTTSISSGRITYQLGPNYVGSMRQFFNSVTNYKSKYVTYQPGMWAAATLKLNGYGSITPNVSCSNLRFYYNTEDPLLKSYVSDKNIYYSVGLNYFDPHWRVNAFYSSGSSSDLYRSIQTDASPVVSRSIQFRPSYENFFFNRTVKLSAYVNYIYYMPSGRENTSYSVKYDQFFKHGWALSMSGFMYSNVRVDKDLGRVGTKDLNFVVGVSKSFNIQQPRLKYYDFKAVFFNDLDGDRIKTQNEPPVTNILVNITKDRSVSTTKSELPELELLSNINGEISVENLPKDNYKLRFNPLTNLENLYFINGSEQSYFNDKTRTLFVPLAESYKIKGKIILVRDQNTSEGKIDIGGVRITATGVKGETFTALTDNFGSFVLSVPNADKYIVHINNVFGESFNIESNESNVQFTQNKTINVDFIFIERKREILFDNGNEAFKFNTIGTQPEVSALGANSGVQPESVETNKTYSIQLAALKTYRNPSYYKTRYKLKEEVLYLEKDGVFKYFYGNFETMKAAKAALVKLGLSGMATEVDRALLIEAVPTEKSNSINNKPKSTLPKQNAKSLGLKTSVDNNVAATEQPAVSQSINQAKAVEPTQSVQQANVPSEIASKVQPQVTKPTNVRSNIAENPKLNSKAVGVDSAKVVNKLNSKSNQSLPVKLDNKETQIDLSKIKSIDKNQSQKILPEQNKPEQKKEEAAVLTKPVFSKAASNSKQVVSQIPAETKSDVAKSTTQETRPAAVQPPTSTGLHEPINQLGTPASGAVGEVKSIKTLPVINQIPSGAKPQNLESKPVVSSSVTGVKTLPKLPLVVGEKNKEITKIQPVKQPEIKTGNNEPIVSKAKLIEKPKATSIAPKSVSNKKYLYTIRLDASRTFRDVKYYKDKYSLPNEVICVEKDSMRNYFTGNYETIDNAKADIARYGLAGFIVPIEESQNNTKPKEAK